jgi:hypothetical protein
MVGRTVFAQLSAKIFAGLELTAKKFELATILPRKSGTQVCPI